MDVVAGTRQTFIPDLQGSILATLDSSTGTLTKRGYLPYGASASVTGSCAYAGQRIDAETNGLYYARARMYSPGLGRFLQPDPIGYDGGLNLYAYVVNDPLNRTDPRGLVDIFIGGKGDNSPKGPVLTYYRQYTQMHPTFITTYFEHDEAEAIRQYIAVQPPGEPIKIVGHSYGAHTAAQVAALVNRRVDLLITIDPVGKPDPGDFVKNVTTWVNVTAAPSTLDITDRIANVGGKGGKLPTEQATSTYSLNVHHGEFAVMMNFEPAGRSSPLNILRTTPSPSTPGLGASVAPSTPGK